VEPIIHVHTNSGTAVSWLSVHEWVTARITPGFPMAGTAAWCLLPDDHPLKLSAVLDGGQHWALRIEGNQEALADASKAIAGAVDWRCVANELAQLTAYRAANPWSRREVS
jgi:hypothetical protein